MTTKNKDAKIILYSFYRSSCAWRVRLALELKNLSYEYRAVNLKPGVNEQMSPDFKKLNPHGQVPVIVFNENKSLFQLLPIIEYLEEVFPELPLLPKEPFERAKIRSLCEIVNSGIQPLQNSGLLRKLRSPEEKKEYSHFYITKGFESIEKIISGTAGKYCFGDKVTMANIFLVPQIFNARHYDVDMTRFPTISKVEEALSKIPAFQKAHALNQIDTPKNLAEDQQW